MYPYHQTLLRYVSDDRFTGTLENPDAVGEVGLETESAGRRLAVRLMLKITGGLITDIRYQVYGCGYTIAACAAAAEFAKGKRFAEIEQLDKASLATRLGGLPEDRGYCLQVALEALQNAVKSAGLGGRPFSRDLEPSLGDEPPMGPENPLYRRLIESPCPSGICLNDRHLFACLLVVAHQGPWAEHKDLGITKDTLDAILLNYFPQISKMTLRSAPVSQQDGEPPAVNPEVRQLIRNHIPEDCADRSTHWFADILAARAAHPGHLWIAMGLFNRTQLSDAIHRHLPTLAQSNRQNMRWKKFFFKQVCEAKGGMFCAAPNCGECSDYKLCFVDQDCS